MQDEFSDNFSLGAADTPEPTNNVQPENISLRQIRAFRACPRQYAYNKELVALDTAADAQATKNLSSLPIAIGTTVHVAAAETMMSFRDGNRPDADEIATRAVERLREQIEWSRERRFEIHPDTVAFEEFVNGNGISESRAAEACRDVTAMCRNLFLTRVIETLSNQLDKPAKQRSIGIREVEELKSFQFEVDGSAVKIWLKLDAVVCNREELIVIDWKTSARDTAIDRDQANVYSLYLREEYGVPRPGVRIINLRGDRWKQPWKWTAEPADLDSTREWLSNEIRLLRRACKEAQGKDLHAAWPQVPFGSPACRFCAYRFPFACNRALL